MLCIQLAMTYLPFMNRLLHTAPIAWWWWVVMTAIGCAVFVLAELKKGVAFMLHKQRIRAVA
jgi:hypothetical protein